MPEEPRFWHPQFERTFGSLIADLPEATRCELEAAVDEELQTHRRRRGGDLLAHARVVVGIRP